jgi:ComF family protein
MDSVTQALRLNLRLHTPCSLCSCLHQTKAPICSACEALFIPLGAACLHCATPLPDISYTRCGHCIKQPPALDTVFTPYRFEEPLRTLLHLFKYHEQLHIALFLAKKMQQALPPITPQTTCLIPIPIHPKRMRTRGFNQAALLAQHLAKQLKTPYLSNHIKKIKNTTAQAELDARTRHTNLRGSFSIKPIPYTHVILVDDLITTGSTANELARQLKNQGVHEVSLWCVAKTV